MDFPLNIHQLMEAKSGIEGNRIELSSGERFNKSDFNLDSGKFFQLSRLQTNGYHKRSMKQKKV